MARPASRLKLGYYPLANEEARRIRRFLTYGTATANVLDPCAGTGAALAEITSDTSARRYAIELDAQRAATASAVLDQVAQGSVFETHSPVESFGLLYLNPPYDFETGEGKNHRLERVFLQHCYRWLAASGVLVLVVPFNRIADCRTVLSTHFRDKAIFRLTEPDAVTYRQAVVFGVRRSRAERERLSDAAVEQSHRKLIELTRNYEAMPPLPDEPDRHYFVPPSAPTRLEYRGLPLDMIEDLLASSPAWLRARRVTHGAETRVMGRPLTPLHRGHVGLLCTSSLLNGAFGEGADRHLAFWESVKVRSRQEEEGERGEHIVRERESFSQRLTLLYRDGRFARLSGE